MRRFEGKASETDKFIIHELSLDDPKTKSELFAVSKQKAALFSLTERSITERLRSLQKLPPFIIKGGGDCYCTNLRGDLKATTLIGLDGIGNGDLSKEKAKFIKHAGSKDYFTHNGIKIGNSPFRFLKDNIESQEDQVHLAFDQIARRCREDRKILEEKDTQSLCEIFMLEIKGLLEQNRRKTTLDLIEEQSREREKRGHFALLFNGRSAELRLLCESLEDKIKTAFKLKLKESELQPYVRKDYAAFRVAGRTYLQLMVRKEGMLLGLNLVENEATSSFKRIESQTNRKKKDLASEKKERRTGKQRNWLVGITHETKRPIKNEVEINDDLLGKIISSYNHTKVAAESKKSKTSPE